MNVFTENLVRQNSYRSDEHTIALLRKGWQEHIETIPPYPGHFEGKGIVICAGGITYMTCAWVNVSMLRMTGCTLPVEIWYTGAELNPETISAFSQLGVECKNSLDYISSDIKGLSLKPFAIMHSSFKEVLFLDADNNCVKDPAYLFHDILYQAYGTIFWPDFWITEQINPIWQIIGSTDYQSTEMESGQILINKEKCWRELNLCMYFNQKREHYYEFLLGDKDTFKFAWIALGTPYNMISRCVGTLGFEGSRKGLVYGLTMVQHDTAEDILFLHRNWLKWDITKEDEPVWGKIKRYTPDAMDRRCMMNVLTIGGEKKAFWDLIGDVEILDFKEQFGDYELRCLDILRTLRNYKFYSRYLIHHHFLLCRPGYSLGMNDKINFETSLLVNY
ncbi:hypothetical protein SIO70_28565 [Chitinophaga sancti]|uniref:hypothetical protein n=1 Tax=Chitinophaga sancti TaxID=1004 RepID=UPI002A753731|nr:hypothetical protein [Chitinophaga sancti]WPQ62317.1 hypothetical protein SIO70_28565 [Chitinophaga sancti]